MLIAMNSGSIRVLPIDHKIFDTHLTCIEAPHAGDGGKVAIKINSCGRYDKAILILNEQCHISTPNSHTNDLHLGYNFLLYPLLSLYHTANNAS